MFSDGKFQYFYLLFLLKLLSLVEQIKCSGAVFGLQLPTLDICSEFSYSPGNVKQTPRAENIKSTL